MLNTLFLAANEKRIIVADRYIFFKKCLFPVNVRILNKFGLESARFENVTSQFEVDLKINDLYKIEITNGVFNQDVQIDSNPFLIKNSAKFNNFLHGSIIAADESAKYSFFVIETNEYSSEIIYSIGSNSYFKILIAEQATNYTTNNTKNLYNANDIADDAFLLKSGGIQTIIEDKNLYLGSSFAINKSQIKLPAFKKLVICSLTIDATHTLVTEINY